MASSGPWLGGGRRGGLDPWFNSPFSSDIWDPTSFGNIWGEDGDDTTALAHARVDWRETDNAHIFRADLPGSQLDRLWRIWLCGMISPGFKLVSYRGCLMSAGVRKEEVKVHVEDGNILQISGERSKEEDDKNDRWHRVERRHGSFVRRFRLPENANLDDIKCSLENGVLTVAVPKTNVESPPRNVRYIDVA